MATISESKNQRPAEKVWAVVSDIDNEPKILEGNKRGQKHFKK